MKLIGNWYLPDYEENPKVISYVESENWQCLESLEKSYKYVKKFNLAIDVGTWVGDSTSIIADKFSTVIGFEADPDVFECCNKNLENIKNIFLYNIALSDSEEIKTLYIGDSTFSAWVNTLDNDQLLIKHKIEKKIHTKTLDSFNFKNIDFLKIDIDSHEGYLLKGSFNFFKENSPTVLIEYKPRVLTRQNASMPDPIESLIKIGYAIKEQVSPIDYVLIRE